MSKKKDFDLADKRLTLSLPFGVFEELRRRAYEGRSTIRAELLRALRKDGFVISEEDLVDRRAEAGKLRAAALRERR
jgi:hypothetical protein